MIQIISIKQPSALPGLDVWSPFLDTVLSAALHLDAEINSVPVLRLAILILTIMAASL